MPTTTDHRPTLARVARGRADALRLHAATITNDALEPLRAALRIRAAELELAAAAIDTEPTGASERPRPPLRAIA